MKRITTYFFVVFLLLAANVNALEGKKGVQCTDFKKLAEDPKNFRYFYRPSCSCNSQENTLQAFKKMRQVKFPQSDAWWWENFLDSTISLIQKTNPENKEKWSPYKFDNHCTYQDYFKDIIIPNKLVEYRDMYNKVLQSNKHEPIAELLKLGEEGKEDFVENNSADNFYMKTRLSNLLGAGIENDFNEQMSLKLDADMGKIAPGYDYHNDIEVSVYEINGESFLKLAKAHGTETDKKFFELYNKNFPGTENWPSYIQQLTDYTGCISFGSKEFIDFYRDWTNFIDKNPTSYYSKLAKKYLSHYEEVVFSGCSCDSKKKTISGLRKLALITRSSKIRKAIESDINQRINGAATHLDGANYSYNGEKCGG